MANVKSSTIWYIDTSGDIDGSDSYVTLNVSHIVVSSTGSAGSIVLAEKSTGIVKIRVNVVANDTTFLRFEDHPITFSTGIEVVSISNCVASLRYTQPGG